MTEKINEYIFLTPDERDRLIALGYRDYINQCSNECARSLYEEKKQLGFFSHLGTL